MSLNSCLYVRLYVPSNTFSSFLRPYSNTWSLNRSFKGTCRWIKSKFSLRSCVSLVRLKARSDASRAVCLDKSSSILLHWLFIFQNYNKQFLSFWNFSLKLGLILSISFYSCYLALSILSLISYILYLTLPSFLSRLSPHSSYLLPSVHDSLLVSCP